eukprot:1581928-Alexandrium_andersonii.AAC.1
MSGVTPSDGAAIHAAGKQIGPWSCATFASISLAPPVPRLQSRPRVGGTRWKSHTSIPPDALVLCAGYELLAALHGRS